MTCGILFIMQEHSFQKRSAQLADKFEQRSNLKEQCTCYWLQLWRPFMRRVKIESYYVYIHMKYRDMFGSYTIEVTEILF